MSIIDSEWEPGENAVRLDERHYYTKYEYNDRWSGIIEHHKRADGVWCSGSVPFAGRDPGRDKGWDVMSEEPLTLSPSILCRSCNEHGWIEGGAWRSA